ncbi:MAG: hypothetical protein PHP57_04505 [Sideroxydans sp.]|nr:hypothetical protein [Sideroxydans sp.]
MAVLAPIAFNISIIIVLAMVFRRTRFLGRFLFYQAHWSAFLVVFVAGLLPAIAGFMMGTSKFATLLGHFFYTNMEHERDLSKTIACWLGLLAIAYLLSGAV